MSDQDRTIKEDFTNQAKKPKSQNYKNGPLNERTRNWTDGKPPEKQNHFYGIERGKRYVRRFKLMFQDGRVLSVPYAYLPLLDFDPLGVLTLKTRELDVIIKGRNMSKLTDWFSEEKVLWVKESPSGIDDGEADVFVQSITVEEKDDP